MLNAAIHSQLISEFLRLHPEDGPCRTVALAGAYPVPWAWEGCHGIAQDGHVVYYDDEKSEWAASLPRREYLATLALASKSHQFFLQLLPTPPAEQLPCSECDGSGNPIIEGINEATRRSILCGSCFGLGWQPKDGWSSIASSSAQAGHP